MMRITLLIRTQNVPALEKENYSPSLKTILPKVQFSLEKFNLEGKQGDGQTGQPLVTWMIIVF